MAKLESGKSASGPLDDRLKDPVRMPVPLYRLDDVRAALCVASGQRAAEDVFAGSDLELPDDTEHQCRLGEIIRRGEAARLRHAMGPRQRALEELDELASRAPHLEALSGLVRRNLLAARVIGLPTSLPPICLLGQPGTGKTWYLSRLGQILGAPFRVYPFSISTLGEGLQGAHPSWRNAKPGLVATTLLHEQEANPLIFVDEFDKATFHAANGGDPWRPFYVLLDPSGSRQFCDEYLGFPMNASHVLWVMAANDLRCVPPPILDRLTIVDVPDMSRDQRAAVATSIYREANDARLGFFDDALSHKVLDKLSAMNPRSVRIAVEDAMTRAAAEGRRAVQAQDIVARPVATKGGIGVR